MAILTGKGGQITVNSDIIGKVTNVSINVQQSSLVAESAMDDTTDWKESAVSGISWSGTLDANFDNATSAADIDAAFELDTNCALSFYVVTGAPNLIWSGNIHVTGYSVSVPAAGVVKLSAQFTGDGVMTCAAQT